MVASVVARFLPTFKNLAISKDFFTLVYDDKLHWSGIHTSCHTYCHIVIQQQLEQQIQYKRANSAHLGETQMPPLYAELIFLQLYLLQIFLQPYLQLYL